MAKPKKSARKAKKAANTAKRSSGRRPKAIPRPFESHETEGWDPGTVEMISELETKYGDRAGVLRGTIEDIRENVPLEKRREALATARKTARANVPDHMWYLIDGLAEIPIEGRAGGRSFENPIKKADGSTD